MTLRIPSVVIRRRWPLAVGGRMPATRASSAAVSARPSIKACSMAARAGSPATAATSANIALLAMTCSANLSDPSRPASAMLRHRPNHWPAPVAILPVHTHEHHWQGTSMAISGKATFFGWRVVAATFTLAVFGWGVGFYGPPVYLQAVRDARGWSLPLVSTAVTVHFLVGAAGIAKPPPPYPRGLGGPGTKTRGGVAGLGGARGGGGG